MRTFTSLAFVVITGVGIASTGCSTAAPPAAKLTDADLERTIEGRFAENAGLKDLDVSANVERNEATLSGTVTTQALRTNAVDMAKAAMPGLVVTDKIDVKPREVPLAEYTEDMAREARERASTSGDKVGATLSDAWVHTKVSTKLATDSDTPARNINVDVSNGVVTLRGNVNSATAKTEATRIATETDGVKRVINQLKIGE